jgi:hypothetical protein
MGWLSVALLLTNCTRVPQAEDRLPSNSMPKAVARNRKIDELAGLPLQDELAGLPLQVDTPGVVSI